MLTDLDAQETAISCQVRERLLLSHCLLVLPLSWSALHVELYDSFEG